MLSGVEKSSLPPPYRWKREYLSLTQVISIDPFDDLYEEWGSERFREYVRIHDLGVAVLHVDLIVLLL